MLDLEHKRAAVPRRIPVGQRTASEVIKLSTERKHLTNVLKMIAYQAESDLFRAVAPHYKRADDGEVDDARDAIAAALAAWRSAIGALATPAEWTEATAVAERLRAVAHAVTALRSPSPLAWPALRSWCRAELEPAIAPVTAVGAVLIESWLAAMERGRAVPSEAAWVPAAEPGLREGTEHRAWSRRRPAAPAHGQRLRARIQSTIAVATWPAQMPVVVLLTDTTPESPSPEFPRFDSVPGCSICDGIGEQTAVAYDGQDRHLSVQVPSTLAAIQNLRADVIVQVAANVEPRRYTAPPEAIATLRQFRNDEWYLPLSAPQGPTAMALVFTFEVGDDEHTTALEVPIL